jgi:hypothetical protein
MLNAEFELIQVRYNTLSDGSTLCWRLVLDGKEHLVNDICIEAPCFTTKDWLEDQQVFKHHITIKNCRVEIDDEGRARVVTVDS